MATPNQPGMADTTDTAEISTSLSTRRSLGFAAAIYGIVTLVLGYPALVGQFLVSPVSDQYKAGYAFREFAAATLRQTGHFPLWNPYIFGGMPYVAAMHGDIFYPTFLLRMVLPTDVAMTWGFMIHVFLAGLFTYVFLRALGLGFYGALIGGLAYMVGGNVAALVSPGHDGKLFISALLPMALFLVLRLVRDGRRWAFGALGLVLGLAVLTPHPQLLQYLLLVTGAFSLFVAFADIGAGKLPRAVAGRRLALVAVAVVIGALIGAVQFLPVLHYVDWSPRAGGAGWAHAISFSLPPEEMINFYLPQFSGILGHYWGRNSIHLHSEYIGASVLILAGLAFARSWSAPQRRVIWFFGGTFVVALLWALGGYTPFYHLVYAVVPGTHYFRAPSTMLFVVSFCTAGLAAFGVERALRWDITARYLIGWSVVAVIVLVLALGGGFTHLAISLAPTGAEDFVRSNDAALHLGALRSSLFVALGLAILFLLGTRRLGRDVAGLLLAVLVVVDLWSVVRMYWVFSPPASVLFASDPAIDYIKKQPTPGRVIPLQIEQSTRILDPFLREDGLMVHRIRNVLGYHGNELGRYEDLGDIAAGWRQAMANPNLWQLFNVHFILTDAPDLGMSSLKRVVGPVTNAAGTTVYLFELPDRNPAAWLTPAILKFPDDTVKAALLDPRFDIRRIALFDPTADVTPTELRGLPDTLAVHASVSRYDPGAIDIQLDAPAPEGSALVVSENYYPGWEATVDGKPTTIGRADMVLIGVPLPRGARAIMLRFHSAPYETGRTVTLVALLVTLLAWGGGALLDRFARG